MPHTTVPSTPLSTCPTPNAPLAKEQNAQRPRPSGLRTTRHIPPGSPISDSIADTHTLYTPHRTAQTLHHPSQVLKFPLPQPPSEHPPPLKPPPPPPPQRPMSPSAKSLAPPPDKQATPLSDIPPPPYSPHPPKPPTMSPALGPPNPTSSSRTNPLAPQAHDDAQTARLRAWAHAREYVVPGEDGTIAMGAASAFDFGDSATKRAIERGRGSVEADGREGGEKRGKEGLLGVEDTGEGEGQERRKTKRGSFSRLFRRERTEEEEGRAEEEVVR
ncbi:hypothetical protein MMC32_006655 [Xylographa parallela]|nr:hypothetical protein [Xylographa parallela]